MILGQDPYSTRPIGTEKSLKEAKDYIAFIQLETNCPITRVSVGPDRIQTIMR